MGLLMGLWGSLWGYGAPYGVVGLPMGLWGSLWGRGALYGVMVLPIQLWGSLWGCGSPHRRRSLFSPHRKLGDGLFLQCCKEVAAQYPEITFNSMIVDNTTMQVGPQTHK